MRMAAPPAPAGRSLGLLGPSEESEDETAAARGFVRVDRGATCLATTDSRGLRHLRGRVGLVGRHVITEVLREGRRQDEQPREQNLLLRVRQRLNEPSDGQTPCDELTKHGLRGGPSSCPRSGRGTARSRWQGCPPSSAWRPGQSPAGTRTRAAALAGSTAAGPQRASAAALCTQQATAQETDAMGSWVHRNQASHLASATHGSRSPGAGCGSGSSWSTPEAVRRTGVPAAVPEARARARLSPASLIAWS